MYFEHWIRFILFVIKFMIGVETNTTTVHTKEGNTWNWFQEPFFWPPEFWIFPPLCVCQVYCTKHFICLKKTLICSTQPPSFDPAYFPSSKSSIFRCEAILTSLKMINWLTDWLTDGPLAFLTYLDLIWPILTYIGLYGLILTFWDLFETIFETGNRII